MTFEERIVDERAGFAAEPRSVGGVTLIAFGGIRGGLGIAPFEFFNVTKGMDVRRAFVRDLDQVWYLRGVRGLDGTLAAAAEALRWETDGERVVCVGNSAGGFGAIAFGIAIGAAEVHAFSPQTAIDRGHRLRWMDLRWMREMRGVRRLHPTPVDLDLRRRLLARPAPPTEVHLHVSGAHRRDLRHAGHLEDLPGVTVHRYPEGGHRLVTDLRDRGVLAEILREATAPSEADYH
jgi:hypothetical protein